MAHAGRKPVSELGNGRGRNLWLSPEANLVLDVTMEKDPSLSQGRAASLLIESADPRWPARAVALERENDKLAKENQKQAKDIAALKKIVAGLDASQRRSAASIKAVDKLDLSGIHPRLRRQVEERVRRQG